MDPFAPFMEPLGLEMNMQTEEDGLGGYDDDALDLQLQNLDLSVSVPNGVIGPGVDDSVYENYTESPIQLVLVNEPPEMVYKNLTYHLKVALVQGEDKLVPFPFYLPSLTSPGAMVEHHSLTVHIDLMYPDDTPVPPKRSTKDDPKVPGKTLINHISPLRGGQSSMKDGVADVPLGFNALSGRGKSFTKFKIRVSVVEYPLLAVDSELFVVRSKPPARNKGPIPRSRSQQIPLAQAVQAKLSNSNNTSATGPTTSGSSSLSSAPGSIGNKHKTGGSTAMAIEEAESVGPDPVTAALESFLAMSSRDMGSGRESDVTQLLKLVQDSVVAPLASEVFSLRGMMAETKASMEAMAAKVAHLEGMVLNMSRRGGDHNNNNNNNNPFFRPGAPSSSSSSGGTFVRLGDGGRGGTTLLSSFGFGAPGTPLVDAGRSSFGGSFARHGTQDDDDEDDE